MARNAAVAWLERLLRRRLRDAQTDYAIVSGIQLHLPGGESLIHPRLCYADVDGRIIDIIGLDRSVEVD